VTWLSLDFLLVLFFIAFLNFPLLSLEVLLVVTNAVGGIIHECGQRFVSPTRKLHVAVTVSLACLPPMSFRSAVSQNEKASLQR
jgi:hypothetical protein